MRLYRDRFYERGNNTVKRFIYNAHLLYFDQVIPDPRFMSLLSLGSEILFKLHRSGLLNKHKRPVILHKKEIYLPLRTTY